MIINSKDRYGSIAVLLHWLVAVAVLSLFALGLWMVELTYYDDWYRTAPAIHKSAGALLCLTVAAQLAWRLSNPRPQPLATHARWEQRAAQIAHITLIGLTLAVILSGYLISTADGRSIDVFGLFDVPAVISGLPNQADVAGDVHLILAVTLVSLAAAHALAALKHHLVDGDGTLMRMLGRPARKPKAARRTSEPSSTGAGE